MVVPEIVTAGFENILPVIIFVVVIGRIINAVKKASSGANPPAKPSGGGERKLAKDLERFFSNLEGKAREVAAPPPVPVAKRARQRAKPVESVPPPPPAAALPVQPMVKTQKTAIWGSENYGISAATPKGANCSYSATKARTDITRMMKDENSLQKAVLLREVLGPPVALRHQEQIHA